ncbi:MAG TPA: DMT family transporter [Gaiellaceae bacterium]|nr:DMT family transporter [Gaiellaceae bacterium]
MTRRYVPLLLTLSALWGASYLFIKVGVRDLAPTVLVELRLLLAAAVLVGFLWLREGGPGARAELRAAARPGAVLGLLNAAVPFVLIAWGERHVDSGVAAVANATVPIFNALLVLRFNPAERVSGTRFAGVLAGLAGVAVLAGFDPRGGWWAVAGTLAVVVASIAYAGGGIYGQLRLSRVSGPALAAASIASAAVYVLPFSLVQVPHHAPGWKSLASAAALGLLGTGAAQLVLFRMLRLHGAGPTSLVTYLLPPTALLCGALFLGEPVTAAEAGGLALILLGVAVGSRLVRPAPRAAVEPGR